MVFLPTDVLLWLLLSVALFWMYRVSRDSVRFSPWLRLFSRPSAMISLNILVFLFGLVMLDSVHFRARLIADPVLVSSNVVSHTEITSMLDVVMSDWRRQTEKTYSAPLSIYAFIMETKVVSSGQQVRESVRLEHAGHFLREGESLTQHVVWRVIRGSIDGFCFALLLVVSWFCCWRYAHGSSYRHALIMVWQGETVVAWRSMLLTWIALCWLIGVLGTVGQSFHVFGTDKVGFDVLYLCVKSLRTGVVIGLLTTLTLMPFAVWLGMLAGWYGGWVDDLIQYVYTTLNSIPGVLLIAASMLILTVTIDQHPRWFDSAAMRADIRLLALCVILGLTSWTGLARLVRGETLKLRELEYVQAARAFGLNDIVILIRHVLPNLFHLVLITVALDFSDLVLAESVLSYIGIGVDPSMISFGGLINEGRFEIVHEPMIWWPLASAFCFMLLLVLPANILADAIRDTFDPRVLDYDMSQRWFRRLFMAADAYRHPRQI